jgi:hypothetical protein
MGRTQDQGDRFAETDRSVSGKHLSGTQATRIRWTVFQLARIVLQASAALARIDPARTVSTSPHPRDTGRGTMIRRH